MAVKRTTKYKNSKISLEEVAKEKHEKKMQREEVSKLKSRAERKHNEYLGFLERFIIFEAEDLPKFFCLSGPLTLYMYLRANINRDPNAKWANLGHYYKEGYLATARTATYIADIMGIENRQNIDNWLNKLEEFGYIKKIGVEVIKSEGISIYYSVWALGEIVNIDGRSYEVLYYEQ